MHLAQVFSFLLGKCGVYTHTMEQYSAIKREMLLFGKTWMDLAAFVLSKISQTEEDEYSYTWNGQQTHMLTDTEHRPVAAGDGG